MFAALLVAIVAGSGSPAAVRQDPPIRLWINNDRHFERGDRAKVQVQTDEDGYVVVLHADPDGRVRVLFPIDPGDDNFLRGGHRYELRGRGNRESFSVDVSSGQGAVYAAYSRDPFRFDDFVQGDHWDFRALNATQLANDPEPDLTDMVRRMAGGPFEYDILRYDVYYGSSSYSTAAYYTPVVVRHSYYDPFCDFSWDCDPYYFGGRSGLSVGLYFGRPYRSAFYDPFYYDPFYYDPFYYSGYGYYRPTYRYPGYYPGYYPRSGYQGQIYTPYQFKTINRTWNGSGGATMFRDRRDTRFDATHTVYGPGRNAPLNGTPSRPDLNGQPRVTPAPSPGRQDAAESRRRRVEESRPEAQPRRVDPKQSEARPQEVKPAPRDRGSEGRRADPIREGQRERQQGSRRFEAIRPQLEPIRPQLDPMPGQSSRPYRAEPENRQYQPPMRAEPVERPAVREYQPPQREARPSQREYQPPQREYQPPQREYQPPQREAPRMAPPPEREAPRAAPAPSEGGSYARPSEGNRGRFR